MSKKDDGVPSGRAMANDAAYIKKPVAPLAQGVPIPQGVQGGREIKPPVKPVETGNKER